LEVLHRCCAGLDVHKASLTACARIVEGKSVAQHIRDFRTTVQGLNELREWLRGYGVNAVVMEATGVYWKPVWHMLEADFELTLANASHVKNVPGRKTDVKDAVWLADLHAMVSSAEASCHLNPSRSFGNSPVLASSWCGR
jgi:transposase